MLQRYRRWGLAHRLAIRVITSIIFAAFLAAFSLRHMTFSAAVGLFVFASLMYFALGYFVFDRQPKD